MNAMPATSEADYNELLKQSQERLEALAVEADLNEKGLLKD